MIRSSSNSFQLVVVTSILMVLAGCSPSPKYHGHPRRTRSRKYGVRKKVEPAPAVELRFSPPLRNFDMNRITSFFGIRENPRNKTREFHRGIDIKAERGEDVLAAADGKVIYSGRQSGYGKVIIIDHGKRLYSVYAHLSALEVRKDLQVKRGQVIGKVGESGRATGTHLHFEIRKAGEAVNPIDYL